LRCLSKFTTFQCKATNKESNDFAEVSGRCMHAIDRMKKPVQNTNFCHCIRTWRKEKRCKILQMQEGRALLKTKVQRLISQDKE